ncbi:Methyltransferase type 11 [Lasiodiplodia theobromae]|uniref:Methyltransferase type 11 n=1 Tax=Lasiodiplodia theobromae TaxID=45133 RepID=UPI0015C2D621|nr:Methyltransferase type 11 [Lasiodiplodia theobromae]KAF4539421.1 Methyltransferase type 11 [Lasiodiplodia theobromae]
MSTEQAAGAIEVDTAAENNDDGYAESSASSTLTSIKSEIRKGMEENGRIYAVYGENEYAMPVDEREQDRLDMQHHKYTLLTDDKLHLAPLPAKPQRILDIGTGTGIWAIDMADKYTAAEVVATDIAPVQPTWVPPNCSFILEDCNSPQWQFADASFDLIHCRDGFMTVRDWAAFARTAFAHLRPGGWTELACMMPVPECDDGSMPPDCAYVEACSVFRRIGEAMGVDFLDPKRYKHFLEDAGYVNVEQRLFKMPSSEWPKDKRLKTIGALERLNVVEGGEAFLVRGVTKQLGMTREQMEVLLARMRKELNSNRIHAWVPFYVVYGQKPHGNS